MLFVFCNSGQLAKLAKSLTKIEETLAACDTLQSYHREREAVHRNSKLLALPLLYLTPTSLIAPSGSVHCFDAAVESSCDRAQWYSILEFCVVLAVGGLQIGMVKKWFPSQPAGLV